MLRKIDVIWKIIVSADPKKGGGGARKTFGLLSRQSSSRTTAKPRNNHNNHGGTTWCRKCDIWRDSIASSKIAMIFNWKFVCCTHAGSNPGQVGWNVPPSSNTKTGSAANGGARPVQESAAKASAPSLNTQHQPSGRFERNLFIWGFFGNESLSLFIGNEV